jgi:hypothetical protein
MPGFRFCGFGQLRLALVEAFGSAFSSDRLGRPVPGSEALPVCVSALRVLVPAHAGFGRGLWLGLFPDRRLARSLPGSEALPVCVSALRVLVPAHAGFGRCLWLGLFPDRRLARSLPGSEALPVCVSALRVLVPAHAGFGRGLWLGLFDRLGRLFPLHGKLPCSLPSEMPVTVVSFGFKALLAPLFVFPYGLVSPDLF